METVNTVQSTIFIILRSALGVGELPHTLSLSPLQWKALFEMALQQKLAALVFDELKSVECDMPESVKSRWKLYADFCAQRFDAQLMTMTQLSAMLEAEKINMMVLKGIGLALTYPKPELREYGDIDIYCFDDYDRVNELVISSGLDRNARETEEKHFGFEVNGIEVENHRLFCTQKNHANIYIGKVLKAMSADEPYSDPRLPGIFFPSVQMGALHLIMHTLAHLAWSGITLRHLCDITTYFRRHQSELDLGKLRETLQEARVEKAAALLLNTCNRHLGLDLDLSGWMQYEKDATCTLLESIFHPFKNSCFTSDPIRKLYRKFVMHRFRTRFYSLVYDEKYPDSFIDSFVFLESFKSRFDK